MNPLRSRACATLVAALALGAAPASAQVLDQSQETLSNAHGVSQSFAVWQTFTPGVTGRLVQVEIRAARLSVDSGTFGDLELDVVTTAAGVPTGVVLGGAQLPAAALPVDATDWVSFDLSGAGVDLVAGAQYALRATSPTSATTIGYQWTFADGGDPYAGGEFFRDNDASNGLDDPTGDLPSSDATFRTFMSVCGNGGAPEPGEQCDDGNAESGDGCSATCQIEICGDAIVSGPEACDDGNTADGDGCDAACLLEPDAAACQAAVGKAGTAYAAARTKALDRCRALWIAGKLPALSAPGECLAEPKAAASVARAAQKARKTLAGGKRPKCSDALLAPLALCADTLDALIAPDAASGCLLTELDAGVDAVLEAGYGY
jgi:cysteine-rich repeat protein